MATFRKQTRPGPTKYVIADYFGIEPTTVKRVLLKLGIKELKSRQGYIIPFSKEETYRIIRHLRFTEGQKITRAIEKDNEKRRL